MFAVELTLDDGVKLGAIVSAFVGAYVASAGVRIQRRRREGQDVEKQRPLDPIEDWREIVDDSRRERDRARRERNAAQIEADDWRRRALDCEERERRSR